ncbi:synaptic vesicle glycoprotein 2B [Chanos chanos]|uniref:Synaptic vesicle glycoprotein 2B n=1 Tax=Chanos chanos TaxID=29144 RepID=A0A6J2VG28_CHACN|nr:synaptic vesicle glycoprotein 2B-like [Chanos chanos]
MSRRSLKETNEDTVRLLSATLDSPDPDSNEEGDVIFERISYGVNGGENQRKLSHEEAIEEAGFGLFHGLLLVVCGWANASDAVEILCVSFLLPTARCDLQLSSSDMGFLSASIFLGMMVGGYVWGCLADRRGRQRVLVVSLTVNGVFGALASLAPSFWLFLLLRFLSGVGVGGSIPVIFSYFSEFQPRLRRGAMISALATFWMAGNILAAGLAWAVIPQTSLKFELGWLDFQSWRLFVVLCSVPSLSSALLFALAMPESPKFLMETGQKTEALRVYQKMFELNHRGSIKTFPVCDLLICPQRDREGSVSSGTRCQSLLSIIREGLDPVRQIFVGPLASRSVVLLIIFFSISFGFYGLWMWIPELFKKLEDGGSPCASNTSLTHKQDADMCYPVKTAVYAEGFITAASNLPGNIFTILLMDFVGGKILLSCSLLLSSISVFFIWLLKTKTQSLIMSCIFSGVSVISWNALDVISTELYPTQLRSSALGFFTGVGRVAAIMGNVTFGQLVDSNCAVPVLLVSALLLSGGLAALKLPSTKQSELT